MTRRLLETYAALRSSCTFLAHASFHSANLLYGYNTCNIAGAPRYPHSVVLARRTAQRATKEKRMINQNPISLSILPSLFILRILPFLLQEPVGI
jgi:hypothetical protein